MRHFLRRAPTSLEFGLYGACIVLGIYNLIFFNKYFPLTEGWFSAYASLILQGKVPYRDFYFFLPPLYPLQLAAFMSVFGSHFVALRLLGVVVILVMTATLYLVYARWFPPFAASLATIVSMMYYQSGVAHIAYDYTQFLTAYALLAMYFIVRHAESVPQVTGRLSRQDAIGLAIAGAMSACVFLTKQSNGFFIALFAFLAVFLVSARWGVRHALQSFIPFMLGALLPVLAIASWLLLEGALSACLQQIYFDAVQSKGSWDSILFGWFWSVVTERYFVLLLRIVRYIAPLFVVNAIAWSIGKGRWSGAIDKAWWNAVMVGCVVLMALGGIWLPLHHPSAVEQFADYARSWPELIVALSTALPVLVVLSCGVAFLARRRLMGPGVFAFAILTLGFIIGNGTSAGIGEISCFLGLGLFVGWLMGLRADPVVGKVAVLAVGFCFIVYLAGIKYGSPYAWWSVEQPTIRGGLEPATLPLMDGLELSPDTIRAFQTTVDVVNTYARPEDSIVAFPHMPAFYLLTNRWPSGKTIVSWFDVVSDRQAKEQAAELLVHPPAVIVYLEMPESVWAAHERLFRHGNSMGQRDIVAAILTLTTPSGPYVLEKSLPIPRDCVLKIWRRRQPGEPTRELVHPS